MDSTDQSWPRTWSAQKQAEPTAQTTVPEHGQDRGEHPRSVVTCVWLCQQQQRADDAGKFFDILQRIDHGVAELLGGLGRELAGEELALEGTFDVIIISDTLNLAADVQRLLERLHRMLGIGGDEHDQRRFDFHHPLDHAETVEPRHLDIEHRNVRDVLLDELPGLRSVPGFGYDLQIRRALEGQQGQHGQQGQQKE